MCRQSRGAHRWSEHQGHRAQRRASPPALLLVRFPAPVFLDHRRRDLRAPGRPAGRGAGAVGFLKSALQGRLGRRCRPSCATCCGTVPSPAPPGCVARRHPRSLEAAGHAPVLFRQARVEVGASTWRAAAPPAEADLALLDTDERRRHHGYLAAEPARIFATTRIALRRLLGARTGRPPAAVRLAQDVHGKPFAPDCAGFSFNVSHCSKEALIAFSDTGSVGVDIETPSAATPSEAFVAMVCSDAERRLAGCPSRRGGPGAGAPLVPQGGRLEGLGNRPEPADVPHRDERPRADIWCTRRRPHAADDLARPELATGHPAAVAVASTMLRSIDVIIRPFGEYSEDDSVARALSSTPTRGTPGRHFHRPGRAGAAHAGRT